MRLSVKLVLTALVTGLCVPVVAQQPDPIASLSLQDLRLAQIADRVLVANDALCRTHMPVTGMVIHTRDQYRTAPGDAFANGRVAVAQVVPGSAAAGLIKRGDGIVSIAGRSTETMQAVGKAPARDAVFDALAAQTPPQPLAIVVSRKGAAQTVTLQSRSGCRALVEVRSANGLNARSDGRVIQVDFGLATSASDDQLAAIFAHEFAHLVLEHRRRLTEAGVSKGFIGEFGKNQRLNRQVEVEADRLSVHLLRNAGFDPRVAPALWRSPVGRRAAGLSAVYPSPEARAQLLEREIAEYLGTGSGPSWPGHLLARRERPF